MISGGKTTLGVCVPKECSALAKDLNYQCVSTYATESDEVIKAELGASASQSTITADCSAFVAKQSFLPAPTTAPEGFWKKMYAGLGMTEDTGVNAVNAQLQGEAKPEESKPVEPVQPPIQQPNSKDAACQTLNAGQVWSEEKKGCVDSSTLIAMRNQMGINPGFGSWFLEGGLTRSLDNGVSSPSISTDGIDAPGSKGSEQMVASPLLGIGYRFVHEGAFSLYAVARFMATVYSPISESGSEEKGYHANMYAMGGLRGVYSTGNLSFYAAALYGYAWYDFVTPDYRMDGSARTMVGSLGATYYLEQVGGTLGLEYSQSIQMFSEGVFFKNSDDESKSRFNLLPGALSLIYTKTF